MKLLEYKAMELFSKYSIPNPKGFVIDNTDEIDLKISELKYPVVIKAQVQVGGRGKAGGIKFASNFDELKTISKKMLGSSLKGRKIKKILVVEKAEGIGECYIGITLDRLNRMPMVIFSPLGGIDIEEVAKLNPNKIFRVLIDPLVGIKDYMVRYILNKSGLEKNLFDKLLMLVKNLYKLFCEYDCLLTEINPLLITGDSSFLALDSKIDIDDSALYRQPDILEFRNSIEEDKLIKEARKFNFLYIPIEEGGKVSVMSNGSGMIMSCIDLISKKGVSVGSTLDLGGGATSDRISKGIKIVFSNKYIKILFINIFGGITRCDEVASGLKKIMDKKFSDRIVIIRLEGTNREEGHKIISSMGSNVVNVKGLLDGVSKIYMRRNQL